MHDVLILLSNSISSKGFDRVVSLGSLNAGLKFSLIVRPGLVCPANKWKE